MTCWEVDCITCEQINPSYRGERCPSSVHSCGHHCNHTWTHDICCWCGADFGDEDDPEFGKPIKEEQ